MISRHFTASIVVFLMFPALTGLVLPESLRAQSGGAVPELWVLNHETPLDAKPFLDRAVVSQVVSAKVARYALRILDRYDKNANGFLEQDEWKIMNGAPQAMDLDGNFILTLEEITANVTQFAQGRTIHHPYPLQQLIRTQSMAKTPDSGLFRPLSAKPPQAAPPKTKKPVVSEEKDVQKSEAEPTEVTGP